jgi:H+/Cl- antiporter ClcA
MFMTLVNRAAVVTIPVTGTMVVLEMTGRRHGM